MSHIYYVHQDDFEEYKLKTAEKDKYKAFYYKLDELIPRDIKYNEHFEALEQLINFISTSINAKYKHIRIVILGDENYGSQEVRDTHYALYRGAIWFYPEAGPLSELKEKL